MTDATATTPEQDLDGKVLLPTRINLRDQRAISNAFAGLPYAADSRVMRHLPSYTGQYATITAERIVDALTALSEVLREHGDRDRDRDREHDQLVRDVAGLRRIMGGAE